MSAAHTPVSLLLMGMAIFCSACSTVPAPRQEMTAPAALDYCNISLTCLKAGETTPTTYSMGESAPMPKLRIFTYTPAGQAAEISFDGVGDGTAVHFNGKIRLTAQSGNSYTFSPSGEVVGFEGDAANKFEASPVSLIITLLPEPAL